MGLIARFEAAPLGGDVAKFVSRPKMSARRRDRLLCGQQVRAAGVKDDRDCVWAIFGSRYGAKTFGTRYSDLPRDRRPQVKSVPKSRAQLLSLAGSFRRFRAAAPTLGGDRRQRLDLQK